jgi:hypothetical protein
VIRVAVVAVVVAVAVAVRALLVRRAPSPVRTPGALPTRLDRGDFAEPGAPWLVVAFTSATCSTCADVARKVAVLESAQVAVQEVEFAARRQLHEKYAIDAVPAVVLVGRDGSVVASFLGPVSAADLWAAVARAREGGAVEPGCS